MSGKTASLWPTDFGNLEVMTPIGILRQQGAALGEQTKNILVGRVKTHGNQQSFSHEFYLYCPPLGYDVLLLNVSHKIDLYPADVWMAENGKTINAVDAEDLMSKLRDIFASPQTKKIVASLLAQSLQ